MATYAKRRNGNGGGNTFKRARLSTSNNNNNNNSSTSTSTLLSPISKRSITKSINNKINNNKNGQGQLYDDFLEIYNFQTDTKSNEDKSTNSQLDLFEMPDIDGDKSISRPKKISDDSITGAYKKKVTYNRLNKLKSKSKSKSNSNSNSNSKPKPKPRPKPKPKPVSKNILKINQTSNINPWNELLDNIEESTVYLPKISLIDDENESDENDQVQIGVNKAQEGGETITTTSIINLPILLNFDNEGEDDEEDDEEEENLQQQLIQPRSLSTSPSNSNSNSNSNSLKPNKTYAQDRSYLILDQSYIDVKQELGESISRKHDFDNNNNDNTEEEEEEGEEKEKENEDINNNKLLSSSSSSSSGGGRVINVHDFKIKSEFKINPILQDIIDGLLSNSFNLQLSSLLEIISKKKKLSISTDMTDMTEGIIDIIIQYVLPLIDSNNKLINWLSSKIIFDIWKSQKSTTIKLKEVEVEVKEKEEKRILFKDTFVNSIQNRLNDIEKNLNLEEENIDELKIIINQIPKIYRSMINELLE